MIVVCVATGIRFDAEQITEENKHAVLALLCKQGNDLGYLGYHPTKLTWVAMSDWRLTSPVHPERWFYVSDIEFTFDYMIVKGLGDTNNPRIDPETGYMVC